MHSVTVELTRLLSDSAWLLLNGEFLVNLEVGGIDKTWTVDYGLDYGMEPGLNNGLNCGPETDSRIQILV